MYDLIIVGSGPAGMGAAIYAARYGLKTLLISKEFGGMALEAYKVENYPGFKSISGFKLMKRFKKHVEKFDVGIKKAEVIDIKKGKGFTVMTSKNEKLETKTLILALGTKRIKLDIPGEDKFLGKGVSRCAICDAPLFKNKIVGVIGGSDAAANSALLLSKYAKKVYIIYRKKEIRAQPLIKKMVEKNKKIEIIPNTNVVKIKGDKKFMKSVIFDNGQEFPLEGVIIEIGGMPSAIIAEKLGIKLDNKKFIKVNQKQETNVKGVYAAGDITTGSNALMQIITAAAEGVVAATSAYRCVNKKCYEKEYWEKK